jgi:hypothetical protein
LIKKQLFRKVIKFGRKGNSSRNQMVYTNYPSGRRNKSMKNKLYIIAILLVLISIFASYEPGTAKPNQAIPTFTIVSVVPDETVTIRTANFPKDKDFRVTMGKIGTLGVGGLIVATTNSGKGGSFQATYNIPFNLKGQALIAIRLQSTTGKYYAYNWFQNSNKVFPTSGIKISTGTIQTTGGTPVSLTPGIYFRTPYFQGYPYFGITGVVQDTKVSVSGSNFPLNATFNVLMGPYGSYGYGGAQVATLSTGSSTTFTASYDIPAGVKGLDRIAIRLQSTDNAFYAYNWFFNRSTGGSAVASNLSFSIQSIITDTSVTILTQNFPTNVEYEVLMGIYGTQGINGTSVGTTKATSGGSYSATFSIPAGLKGQERIAIRLVGKDGSFAYNWFYNISAGAK